MNLRTTNHITQQLTTTLAALTLTAATTSPTHAIIWSGDHPSSPNWDASEFIGITAFTNWDGLAPIPPVNDTAQFGNLHTNGGFGSGTPTLNGSRQMLTLNIHQDGDQPILADSNDTLNLLNGNVTRSPESTGTHSIGSNIHQLTNSLWTINGTAAGSLHMNASISGAGNLTKLGTHALHLAGTNPNTYTGNTIISAGTVTLAKPDGINAIPSLALINGPAILRHDPAANEQLPNSAPLILNHADALYDLNGTTETIVDITQIGTVHLGGGTLNVTDYDANGGTIDLQNGTLNVTNPDPTSPAPTTDSALTPGGINISNHAIFSLQATTLTANGTNSTTPTPGQTITIDNNATLTTSAAATINLIGGAKTIEGTSADGGNLNLINGSFTLSTDSTLNAQGGPTNAKGITPGHAGSTDIADGTANIDGTINLNGRNGRAASAALLNSKAATRGSNGGNFNTTNTANVTINGTLNLSGGNGGNGVSAGSGVGNGGHGRHAGTINVQGGSLTFDNAANANLTGGNGGVGVNDNDSGSSGAGGGNGGNAGNGGVLDIFNGDVFLLGNSTIDLTRGTPHPGGNDTGAFSGQNGKPGAPGEHGVVNLAGGSLNLTAGLITAANTTTPSADPLNIIGTTLTIIGTAQLNLNDDTSIIDTTVFITPNAAINSPADPTSDPALPAGNIHINHIALTLDNTPFTANGANGSTPLPGQTITIDNNGALLANGTTTIDINGGKHTDNGGTSANGGSINMLSGAFTLDTDATLNAQGGQSSNATIDPVAPGQAGSLNFANGTANIHGTANLTGQNGANSVFPTVLLSGHAGTNGGTLNVQTGADTTITGQLNMPGGNGGNGVLTFEFSEPTRKSGSPGLPGGNGGTINVTGGTLTFDNNAHINLTGGNGGTTLDGQANGNGGDGGHAGNGGQLNLTGGTTTITGNATIDLTPGTPQPAGLGDGTGSNGNPGNPGAPGTVNASAPLILTHGLITADNTASPTADPINLIATTLTLADAGHLTLNDNTTLTNAHININVPTSITTSPDKTLTLDTNSTLTDQTSATIHAATINNGTINGPAAFGQLTFANHLSGQGNYTGHIKALDTYAPGNSTAVNNFTGDLTLAPTANLQIEVLNPATPSPSPGTDHDQVNITDNVTLAGTLDVVTLLDNGNVETTPLGTTYDILTYTTRTTEASGFFNNIIGTLLNTSFALAPLINDSDDTLQLRATIPGDLNLDNKVSVADLSTFALNFGTTPGLYNDATDTNSWQLGDFNTDGQITVADLSLLALNFGFELLPDGTTTPPTPLSLFDVATLAGIDPNTIPGIPEPTTATILLTLALPHLIRNHRQSAH